MLSDAAAAPTDSVAGIIFLCFSNFKTSEHTEYEYLKKKVVTISRVKTVHGYFFRTP